MSNPSLFPETNTCFPNELDLYRTTSHFTESPFPANAKEVHECYFPSADVTEQGGAEIVAENNVSPVFVQEMIAFCDSNANGLMESDEKPLFTYTVKIFVSKDATYLKQAFDKLEPDPADVCFFLEDNSTDLLSGRTAYIKAGTQFRDNAQDRSTIAIIETKTDFFGRYQQYTQNGQPAQLDFSGPEIKELIETGQISNPSMTFIIAVYQLLNIQNIILAPVFSVLSDGLSWITTKAREYFEFQDYHWDPQAKRPEGQDNQTFTPVLFSLFGNLPAAAEENTSRVVDMIKKGIDAQEAMLKAGFAPLLSNTGIKDFVCPDTIKQFITTCFNSISQFKNFLYSGIDTIVNTWVYIGEKWLNVINAFYCGLWNSVAEIFLGMIDTVQYVFLFLSVMGDAVSNAQTLVPDLLESFDEFIQTILNTDTTGSMSAVLGKLAEKVMTINPFTLTNSISIERVGYFLGNIGGFIVQLFVDAFYSGGTKEVLDLIEKFGTVGAAIKDAFTVAIKRFIGSPGKFSAELVTKAFNFLIDLFKKGKEQLLKWIDDFFSVLEAAAKLGEEFIEKIRALLGYTQEQIEALRKYGLEFVQYAEEGADIECALCRILVNE